MTFSSEDNLINFLTDEVHALFSKCWKEETFQEKGRFRHKTWRLYQLREIWCLCLKSLDIQAGLKFQKPDSVFKLKTKNPIRTSTFHVEFFIFHLIWDRKAAAPIDCGISRKYYFSRMGINLVGLFVLCNIIGTESVIYHENQADAESSGLKKRLITIYLIRCYVFFDTKVP